MKAGHISIKTICVKIQFSIYQHQKKNASPKNVPDLVLGISDLVRFTDLLRFGQIRSDLVIRVTAKGTGLELMRT